MKKFLSIGILLGFCAVSLGVFITLRLKMPEEPAISIVVSLADDVRPMDEASLEFNLKNDNSCDVRVVGLNWC